jgi:hypothetical protein
MENIFHILKFYFQIIGKNIILFESFFNEISFFKSIKFFTSYFYSL